MTSLADLLSPEQVAQLTAYVDANIDALPTDLDEAFDEVMPKVASYLEATANIVIAPKEKPMIDLSTMTDAQIGALVRSSLASQAAAEVPAAREAAQAAAVEVAQADLAASHVERAVRVATPPLAAIVVDKSLTVPALDLTEVTSLDVVVQATMRSPYNKANYRLKSGDPLAKDTTYAQLAAEHVRLAALVGATEAPVAAPVEAAPQVAAVLDADAQAKVNALVTTLGWSVEKATAFVA